MAQDPKKGTGLENQRRQFADDTTKAAKAIIEAETVARDKKTAKLRALRLSQTTETQQDTKKKKPTRKKA